MNAWGPPTPTTPSADLPRPAPQGAGVLQLRRAAEAVAIAVAGVAGFLVAIWAATGAGHFWPYWPITALALPLAVLLWVAWVLGDPRRRVVDRGFTITAGIYAAVVAYLVAVWAGAGGGRPLWPMWPLLAFGVALLVHVAIAHGVRRPDLNERIATLTSTRAAAIDAQEAELRRIERDLHDGAQARLVALGMTIGLAEQKLVADPDGARELLVEARLGAQEALGELRDLARGIHPPVLQDRGLVAAVRELAVRAPFDVHVSAEVERLPPAIESAAYFVVAEALANAGKHAGPSHVDVVLARRGALVIVEIADDGRGGADPHGAGLGGLRKRVEALDGTLRVASPPGGPTVVRAEIPSPL